MKALRSMLSGLVTNLVFLAILLIAAGTLTYWPAWAYFGLSLASTVLMRWAAPDLAAERGKPGQGIQDWDKKLLGLNLLLTLAMLVVAGLDAGRFHWNPRLDWPWAVGGVVLDVGGMALFLLALEENRFFSSVVRLQTERGHSVCTSGPYRFIRHPGNAGMIVGTLGLPFLFLSAWSAIPAVIAAAVLVKRTQLEDAFLARELEGYPQYQQETRFRLIPGVW